MEKRKVSFRNTLGEAIVGDFYPADKANSGGVIFGHCFTCSRHTRILMDSCTALQNAGIASLRFDFSGNGQSEGDFSDTTYSKSINEMIDAVSWMKNEGVSQIILAGHSMGAAVALLTSQKVEDIKGVCTFAGRYSNLAINSLLKESANDSLIAGEPVKFISRNRSLSLKPGFFTDIQQYDLPAVVTLLTHPILAIHGDKDEIIPVDEVYNSQKLNPDTTEIFVVENADHMFSEADHRSAVSEKLTNWSKKILNIS